MKKINILLFFIIVLNIAFFPHSANQSKKVICYYDKDLKVEICVLPNPQ